MLDFVDGARGQVPDTFGTVFALTDEIHRGLVNVRPTLSAEQLEQINTVLLHAGRLLGKRINGLAPTLDSSSLQDACSELLTRQDSHPSPAWTNFVVRAMYLLGENAGLGSGPFTAFVWNIVAQSVEENYNGVGRTILLACIDSVAAAEVPTSDGLKVLMDCVITTLRRSRTSPSVSQPNLLGVDGDAEARAVLPSQHRLRLVFDVASQILEVLRREALRKPQEGGVGNVLEAWRWDLHLEVGVN